MKVTIEDNIEKAKELMETLNQIENGWGKFDSFQLNLAISKAHKALQIEDKEAIEEANNMLEREIGKFYG